MKLNTPDGSSFLGNLTTVGRVSGKTHTVKLRLVLHEGNFYASRRNADGGWLKNIVRNPSALIEVNGEQIECLAELLNDVKLSQKISELKYRDKRREEKRVVVRLIPGKRPESQ